VARHPRRGVDDHELLRTVVVAIVLECHFGGSERHEHDAALPARGGRGRKCFRLAYVVLPDCSERPASSGWTTDICACGLRLSEPHVAPNQ
jgi:hypothetical protein